MQTRPPVRPQPLPLPHARLRPAARAPAVAWSRALARLLVPVECPGCGMADVSLCSACARTLTGAPTRCEADAPRLDRMDGSPSLPVWTSAPYAGPLRGLVVAWKDKGRLDLATDLEGAAYRAGRDLAPWVHAAVGPVRGATGGRARVLVVPAPSSFAARRARGREPVRGLARAVARGLVDGGVDAVPAPVLAQRGRDQVGLGSRRRGARLGAVRLARSVRSGAPGRGRTRRPGPGVPCLLVDDVLTTGATLASCRRVLEEAGARVLGAFVLAATPPPRRHAAARQVHLS